MCVVVSEGATERRIGRIRVAAGLRVGSKLRRTCMYLSVSCTGSAGTGLKVAIDDIVLAKSERP